MIVIDELISLYNFICMVWQYPEAEVLWFLDHSSPLGQANVLNELGLGWRALLAPKQPIKEQVCGG